MEKNTMSVKELAERMGISLPMAYDLTRREDFPSLRVGARILILQELKPKKIWVCWQYAVVKGKRTKKPVSAAKEKGYDGVSFIIPEGYVFLDIDRRALGDDFVQVRLRRFHTYTERSISGEGFHFYGKCDTEKFFVIVDKKGERKIDKTFYVKNPNNGMELYVGGLTNRFAVFTGDVVPDVPISDCTAAVLTTLDKDMRRAEKKKYSPKRDGDKNIYNIISKLQEQKNGEKFSALFDYGDITGYGSPSEADAALCALIAFRTGTDAETLDAIFRQSALYREKWKREDCRKPTAFTPMT